MSDKQTVLIIDDDRMIRSLAQRILGYAGFDTIVVASGEAGLTVLKNRQHVLRLVIADFFLDGISGIDLAHAIHTVAPALPVIVSSGDHIHLDNIPECLLSSLSILQKPYRAAELVDSVRTAIASP